VFCVLDDVCKTVTKVDPDNALADRLSACNGNEHFKHRGKAFTIKHYAGDVRVATLSSIRCANASPPCNSPRIDSLSLSQVTYEVGGMPEKNKDTLFKDLLETIKLAENTFLSQTLFPEEVDRDSKKAPTTFGYKIKVQMSSSLALTLAIPRLQLSLPSRCPLTQSLTLNRAKPTILSPP
jgi:myosin-1